MSDSRKIIKVFLGSPGDLENERRSAKQVVDEFNQQWADALGYHVELVGWEETVAGFGRPQAIINRDLERCEYFVGIMYRRWGSAPDKTGTYSSGFEEEFQTSLMSAQKTGKPEISLLFKDIEPEFTQDPGEDLRKVLAFQEKIRNEKHVLYQTFSNIREFEAKVRGCIASYVQKLRDIDASRETQKSQSSPTDESSVATSDTDVSKDGTLTAEEAAFIQGFLAKAQRPRDEHPVTAVEVARFRLLSLSIQVTGNDNRRLGVHDANLIFADREKLDLSEREKVGLIDVGLSNFPHENAPVWHWYKELGWSDNEFLSVSSMAGPESQRIGAISAMRLIGEKMGPDKNVLVQRSTIIATWLKKSRELKIAGLGYLGELGSSADLPTLREEFDKGDYQTTAAAVEAIVRVSFRESRKKAIEALYELQPESIDESLLSEIFSEKASIDRGLLEAGLSHRNSLVRLKVSERLAAKNQLAVSAAEILLKDADAAIRFIALKFLINTGRVFSENEAKGILVKRGRPVGLLSLAMPTSEGEEQFSAFKKLVLQLKSDAELREIIANGMELDWGAYFVFSERHFSREKERLREAIDDGFNSEFERFIVALEKALPSGANTADQIRALEETLKKGYMRSAIDILCRKGIPEDLERVRRALRSEVITVSELDIKYLSKVGEWEDAELIATLYKPGSGTTLLGLYVPLAKYRQAAEAIYNIGKSRFSDVCALDMPPQILTGVFIVASDKNFRFLSDEAILKFCSSNNDRLRKACALKTARSLPKNRLKLLLDRHAKQDTFRYYNVIHWLDFAFSLPKEQYVPAIARTIDKIWPRE